MPAQGEIIRQQHGGGSSISLRLGNIKSPAGPRSHPVQRVRGIVAQTSSRPSAPSFTLRISTSSLTSCAALVAVLGLMFAGCTDGRRVARTTPERTLGESGEARDASAGPKEALPGGGSHAGETRSHAEREDQVEETIAAARELYDQGLETMRSGDLDQARAQFDAAVAVFTNSSIPVSESPQLQEALDMLQNDIASLELDIEEAPGGVPDAEPSPVEGLEGITTELSPEQAQKEMEKVGPEAQAISFDIPMIVNEKVLGWVEIFKERSPFRKSFVGGYERYGWYEPMIHRIFDEEGLPADLIYLAFLESTYKTSAYSRARAKGIWQFMIPTGREYGLKVNRYVDERSHPEKSTRAAARYLKDLYATFGDWHLAMAAYNTGAGNVLRAQKRSGKTAFWDLAKTKHMRTETKNFVPAILALALMSKDPATYGFEAVEHGPELRTDRVTVDGPTKLSLVARLAGVTEDEIRFLNPHLRMGVTPPGERDYEVLVPRGRATQFIAAYQALPEQEKRAKLAQVHRVARGETLQTIAGRYGTTVQELVFVNRIKNPNRLSVGTELTVPSLGEVSALRATSRATSRPSRLEGARADEADQKEGAPYHVIRRGDTLSAIARSYGVPLKSLLSWNSMTERTVLRPGTRIVVNAGTLRRSALQMAPETPAPARVEASTIAVAQAGMVSIPGGGQAPPDPAGDKVVYRIRRGDNLFRIAQKFRTSVDNLKEWNNIPGDSIRAGATLTIYPN